MSQAIQSANTNSHTRRVEQRVEHPSDSAVAAGHQHAAARRQPSHHALWSSGAYVYHLKKHSNNTEHEHMRGRVIRNITTKEMVIKYKGWAIRVLAV